MNDAGPLAALPPSRASFGRSVRLLLNRDFQKVFEQGRSIAGRTMVIWIGEGGGTVRMGAVASKRTFRRAVDRNRAKRLVREAFRLERATLVGTADLVIVARRRLLDAGVQTARDELRRLTRLLGLAAEDAGRG